MAKRQATRQEAAETNGQILPQGVTLSTRPKPGQRRNIHIEETVEALPAPEEAEEAEQEASGEIVFDEDADAAAQLTPLQKLLLNLQGATDAIIYVIRKADPVMLRGRFKESCDIEEAKGQLPFEDSLTDPEAIAMAVQQVFGGGCYKLQIRQGGTILKTWSATVSDPRPPRADSHAAPETLAPAPAAPVRVESELEELERTAGRLKRLRDLMGWDAPAPAAPVAQLPPAPSVESQLLELAKSDDSLKHKIIDRYFGREDEEGGTSIVGEILKHPQEVRELVRDLAGLVVGVMSARLGAAQPPANGDAPPAPQPPAPHQISPPIFALLEPYRPLIEGICVLMLNNAETDEAFALCEHWRAERPELGTYLYAIAEMSSVEVLNTLAGFTGNPYLLKLRHAAEWTEEFQSKLRGEPAADDGEEAIHASAT